MFNYMKSEWYRITHTMDIYLFTFILAGLPLLMNVVLFVFGQQEPNFPYDTVTFSLRMLSFGMDILFPVGAVIAGILFYYDKRNGILKNVIASGISREKMFMGKSIVCALVSICSMIVILFIYIGSAVLLLEPATDDTVFLLLKGIVVILVMTIAFQVLAIGLLAFFEKEIIVGFIWYLIASTIPHICSMIGRKSVFFREIAMWMPANYLEVEAVENMSSWILVWETPQGIAKCLISGAIGLLVFFIIGLKICRKQEV